MDSAKDKILKTKEENFWGEWKYKKKKEVQKENIERWKDYGEK